MFPTFEIALFIGKLNKRINRKRCFYSVLFLSILLLSGAVCMDCTAENKSPLDLLPTILTLPDYQIRSGIFFEVQNTSKVKVIRSILALYETEQKVVFLPDADRFIINKSRIRTPQIEFKKMNPIKYRVRVHGAVESFPMIFSESYHEGWKAYLKNEKLTPVNPETVQVRLEKYKILEYNGEDQATSDELKNYIEKNWITSLGDGLIKGIEHYRFPEGKKKELDHVEKYYVDFISKNFHGTIQNDNLPDGRIWETWRAIRLDIPNPDEGMESNEYFDSLPENRQFQNDKDNGFIQWPEIFHWKANGYANSWWIDLDGVKKTGFFQQNPNGSIDFEFVIEFWPQRLFYFGSIISLLTLFGCVAYLIIRWNK